MAHGQVTVPVAGELRSVATDGRTVAAEGVYDYNLQKTQEQINQELYNGTGSGSSTPVDAYTKAQSDSKYATKTELNSVANNTNHATINKTWSEMIQLKNSNGFVPGQSYRITDYQTVGNTVAADGLHVSGYAGHPFDVIVTALTENTLSEDARAAKHVGDSYFANCKLEAWKLKYVLDPANDYRYRTTGGNSLNLINSQTKGWIYWMEDEHLNSANYDFKNILTYGVQVTDFKYKDYVAINQTESQSIYIKYINIACCGSDESWSSVLKDLYTVDQNSKKLLYLFSYLKQDGTVIDASVEGVQGTYPYANKMSEASSTSRDGEYFFSRPMLNVFVCDWEYAAQYGPALPANNSFGQRTWGNTFGNRTDDNLFLNWANCCVFGNIVYENKMGDNIAGFKTGNRFYKNTLSVCDNPTSIAGNFFADNEIHYISGCDFGNEFAWNQAHYMSSCTIGDVCKQNKFPYVVQDCTIGMDFVGNEGSGNMSDCEIGDFCHYNDFDSCEHLTLGHYNVSNRFHSRSVHISMGDYCQNNTFEGGNQYIKLGDRCYANHFEKQVQYIVFGSSETSLKGFYYGNTICSYNDHIALNATATLSTSNRFIGIRIEPRLYSPRFNDTSASSYTYKVISNSETEQQFTTTYTSSNSKTINA